MPSDDRVHELLPWYLTHTLEPHEAAVFREHLPGCEPCREEMAIIQKIQAQVEQHGGEFLEDHPSAESLVAAVRGELEGDDAERVRRHIALCAACASEARWASGRPAAAPAVTDRPSAPARRGARGAWAWLGAAAALVLAFMITQPLRTPVGPSTGVVTPQFVVPTERAEAEANVFPWPPESRRLLLIFEVDLAPGSFPVALEIRDAEGEVVHRQAGLTAAALVEGTYLYVDCHRRDCEPGSYTAMIGPIGDHDVAPLEFRFRVVAPTP